MIAAVTGANGYVGSIVTSGLSQAGFQIRRLVRRPEACSSDYFYDIGKGCSPGALEGADVLVHCAYDFSVTSRTAVWETNVFGTRSLLDLAVSSGVRRTIVMSSMSAYAGTRQIYGQAKLASEIDAFARAMCAVRPGLVYGTEWGGMIGTLRKLVSCPVVPLVGCHAHQFMRMTFAVRSLGSRWLRKCQSVRWDWLTRTRFHSRCCCELSRESTQTVIPYSSLSRGARSTWPCARSNGLLSTFPYEPIPFSGLSDQHHSCRTLVICESWESSSTRLTCSCDVLPAEASTPTDVDSRIDRDVSADEPCDLGPT